MWLRSVIILLLSAIVCSDQRCSQGLDNVAFKGTCMSKFRNTRYYSYISLKQTLQSLWNEDIIAHISSSPVSNTTRSYIAQELNNIHKKLIIWEAEQLRISQMLDQNVATITKLVANVASLTAQNEVLQKSNLDLQEKVKQLETSLSSLSDNSLIVKDHTMEDDGSLVTRACKLRQMLGGKLTESCRQVL